MKHSINMISELGPEQREFASSLSDSLILPHYELECYKCKRRISGTEREILSEGWLIQTIFDSADMRPIATIASCPGHIKGIAEEMRLYIPVNRLIIGFIDDRGW